ncbi:MAG: acyl-CoA dehydrogenase family protein [Candidatus Hydrogenedentes bacterium]|nr:acyl-CoA dehydrogenase family protein [Candidatus Hydrogenedentota bacterium]
MSTKEDLKAKDAAMELAEEAREKEWKFPSFTAEMFRGRFRWDLVHPYPEQSEEDKKAGDEMIEKIKAMLEEYVDPIEIDKTGEYPREALEKMKELGLFGLKIPKEYGGLGLSITNYGRILSFIGSYCQSTITWLSAHQSIGVPEPLRHFGTEEQKKKYLPRVAKGEISAFALTEPEVGSDPARMKTTATPSPDGSYYLLNGTKLWTTNGPDADVIVVMAKTPPKIVNGKEIPQITAFIVETSWPGVEVVKRCKFMGLKGLSNGMLRFNNVKVPAENIIGKPGMGLKIALTTLNTGRLGVPSAGVGVSKRFLEDAEWWAKNRVQWGRPIGQHQEIAKKIANFAANTFAMQAMVHVVCSFADKKNADIRLEAAAAKYFATEFGWQGMDDLLQTLGGRGYETAESLYNRGERPFFVERVMRDMRVGRIFEGSSEIMHLIMAREAVDTHFQLVMPIIKKKKGDSLLKLLWNAFKFYAKWYPTLWLPSSIEFNVKYLNSTNRDHLRYAAKTCKRLARNIFHTMAKYGPKLEEEQLILGNYVDIGVDLFVMACCLSYAEHLLKKKAEGKFSDLDENALQLLADLFCKNARQRIENSFKAVKCNHNYMYRKVGDALLEGKYRWLVFDTYSGLPPKYRDYEKNLPAPPTALENSKEEAKV